MTELCPVPRDLVTCLCLTKNRREWLPKAIACFEEQTYENRELLIVADQISDVLGIAPVGSERIWIATSGPRTVGTKRNIGCQMARGELIAIWDDDDYSAPGRLAEQVARLKVTGVAMCGYSSMKFTDGKDWWLYRGPVKGYVLATSMCFTKDFWRTHAFDELDCGQDEAFCTKAQHIKQLAPAPDLDLMYATIHPGNTSPRDLKATMWKHLPGYQWAA